MKKKLVLLAFLSVLLSTTLTLCAVGLLELQIAYASPYTNIDVHTAYNMITNGSFPDLVVLDVRYQYEYDSGHIYGAVWIPVSELATRIGELAGHENHEIIVYCASGGRSVTASGILESNGFTKVYNMQSGFNAWDDYYPVWIATVHNLNTTFNYDTIQAAIDAPRTLDGHTISVDAGTYYENVVVNKTVSLIGENRETTIIDSNGTGNVVFVTADNVNIRGFTIENSGSNGIYAYHSNGNNITYNIITNNYYGVYLGESLSNSISENSITNNDIGIELDSSSFNTISGNNITNNPYGVWLEESFDNEFYHNNFIDNARQVYDEWAEVSPSINIWDDDYPSGGNYWSNYTGVDSNHDGIGDTQHIIDENNTDRYPLMNPWGAPPPPSYTLTVHSSPTGVTFTVDNASRTTPWSGNYSGGASISLVMPETHNGSVWSNWLEDADTNRTKIVTMDTNITLTAVYTPTPPVGGISIPVNKLSLLAPYIGLTILLAVAVVAVVYVRKKERNRD